MTKQTDLSRAAHLSRPPLYDGLAVAAWLAARRRTEPRRDAAGPRRVAEIVTCLAATGVPFTAKDIAELAEVRGPAVSSALRSARIAGQIVRVELAILIERVDGTLWLGAGHPVPSGFRLDKPIEF